MTPIKQTILHDPDNGLYGNCAQAAFASLFDLPIDDVPHFGDGLNEGEKDGIIYDGRVQTWLKTMGYGLFVLPVHCNLKEWQDYIANVADHHLISGRTERNTQHAVVGKRGVVIHDPHPSNAGLLSPTDDEPWYFEFIVKRL